MLFGLRSTTVCSTWSLHYEGTSGYSMTAHSPDSLAYNNLPIGPRSKIELVATEALRRSQIMLEFTDDPVDLVLSGKFAGYPEVDEAYTIIQGIHQKHVANTV